MKAWARLFLALACLGSWAVQAEPDLPAGVLEAEMAEDWSRAAAHLERALQAAPARRDWWQRLAQVRAAAGQRSAAADALVRAAQTGEPSARLYAEASAALSYADRPQDALALLGQARALAPKNSDLMWREVALANWLGDTVRATSVLRQLWLAHDDNPDVGFRFAQALAWQGETDEAREVLVAHLKGRPDHAEALLLASRLESWRGDYAQATDWLDRYRDAGGEQTVYVAEKAAVLAWADRPHDALRLIERMPQDEDLQARRAYAEAVAMRRLNRNAAMQGHIRELRGARPDGVVDPAGLERYLTTSLRDSIGLGSAYSSDSDGIDIWASQLIGNWWAHPGLRLDVELGGHRYDVSRRRGLEALDVSGAVAVTRASAGLAWFLSGHWQAAAQLGRWMVDNAGDEAMSTGGLSLGWRPNDALRLRLGADRAAHAVSPRAVERLIYRDELWTELSWQPSLRWTLNLRLAEADFGSEGRCAGCQDDNQRSQIQFSALRRLLFRQDWNLSAGLRAANTRFDKDLDNGYYDPRRFETYALVSNLYKAWGQNRGLAVTAAAGLQRDPALDSSFSPAFDLSTELSLGIWSDWLAHLRLAGSYGVSQVGDDYSAISAGVDITRRF